jgi:hypothetical protein
MASVKFPNFPSVDFSKLDLSNFDLSKFDLSKFDLGKLPKVDLPKVDLPKMDGDAVVNAAKDAAYIGVGVAVLAFQKAQVLRRDLTKSFNDQFGNGKTQFEDLVKSFDSRLSEFEDKFDAAVEGLGKRLPDRAATVVAQAHDASKSARKQVRDTLKTAA